MSKDSITHLFTNTEPINRRTAAKAMREFYAYCKQPKPEVVFAEGPKDVERLIGPEDEGFSFFDHQDIACFGGSRGIGRNDRIQTGVTSPFWKFGQPKNMQRGYLGSTALLVPSRNFYKSDYRSDGWSKCATKVWDESLFTINFKDKSIIVERPSLVLSNERGLHCDDGPALVFRDGSEFFFWNGEQVSEQHLLNPETMTLKDIHQHNSRKHILIAMFGVENYLELCKTWKPNVAGMFQKFHGFAEMVVPGDENIKDSWNKKGRAHHYVDKPYTVDFYSGSVNSQYGMIIKHRDYSELHHFVGHPFETDHWSQLFNECDRALWDSLDIKEMKHRGPLKFNVSYQNGVFSLSTDQMYEGHPTCRHDVAPSWFKAKIFLGQDALYENEELEYTVKYEDGNMYYGGKLEYEESGCRPKNEVGLKCRQSLFGGCENIPSYQFDVKLMSDSWEGLLEKWETLAFNWLGMFEDSSRLP